MGRSTRPTPFPGGMPHRGNEGRRSTGSCSWAGLVRGYASHMVSAESVARYQGPASIGSVQGPDTKVRTKRADSAARTHRDLVHPYFRESQRVIPQRIDFDGFAAARGDDPVADFGIHPCELITLLSLTEE